MERRSKSINRDPIRTYRRVIKIVSCGCVAASEGAASSEQPVSTCRTRQPTRMIVLLCHVFYYKLLLLPSLVEQQSMRIVCMIHPTNHGSVGLIRLANNSLLGVYSSYLYIPQLQVEFLRIAHEKSSVKRRVQQRGKRAVHT